MQHLLFAALAAASFFHPTLAVAAPPQSQPPLPGLPELLPQRRQQAGIRTSSGIVVGHPAPNRTGVTEFLGIRYAEAPVGTLRFAAPKKYVAPKETVFVASDWVGGLPCLSR